jgi:fumarate hydratase class II
MTATRTERDSLGEMQVPAGALYGAQTQRAVENFPISGWPMPREFIAALGLIKAAAAAVHHQAGRLDPRIAAAIIAAAGEVAQGKLDAHFPVDTFQTGSGTSTNMNANEVIANRAMQILGAGPKGGDGGPQGGGPQRGGPQGGGPQRGGQGAPPRSVRIHPNDHVNLGQSSNDVIPTALHLSAATAIQRELLPALSALSAMLREKAQRFDGIVKIGRTHLMDAVPVRLGHEFGGYAAQIDGAMEILAVALGRLCELPLGGTAVGTGLNAPVGFAASVCAVLAEATGLPFREVGNHFAASGARDVALFASAALRSAAIAMGKIASDIRLMGSGPRCGLGELLLPAVQPGSSIMPGKVNPVICESVIQVACQVVGCDAAIAAGATGGVGSILDLNVAMPLIATNLLTAIRLLANVAKVFTRRCLAGLEANEPRCRELVEQSLAMVTVLAPRIGYDAAAEIAKQACQTGKTIRELCLEKAILPAAELEELLDARSQTGT